MQVICNSKNYDATILTHFLLEGGVPRNSFIVMLA